MNLQPKSIVSIMSLAHRLYTNLLCEYAIFNTATKNYTGLSENYFKFYSLFPIVDFETMARSRVQTDRRFWEDG